MKSAVTGQNGALGSDRLSKKIRDYLTLPAGLLLTPAGVTSHEWCVSQHYRDVNMTFVIRLQSISLTSDSLLDEKDATEELKQPSAISSSLPLSYTIAHLMMGY